MTTVGVLGASAEDATAVGAFGLCVEVSGGIPNGSGDVLSRVNVGNGKELLGAIGEEILPLGIDSFELREILNEYP